ncbi:MAG: Na+/H+ antiporter [Nocardioidaceae bacterium]
MHVAAWIVALVAVVTLGSGLSRRLAVPAPLFLTVVGLGVSFIPGLPQITISPEVVLVGFLPPLLYAASLQTSLVDFRRNARPIALLSVGLVLVSTVVVGFVVWALLPIELPVAMALGAVVAPPDAVAATSIARRVGMPRRMVTILEGEGLVNDATALVALRTAIAAIGGSFSLGGVGLDFLIAAGGGVAVGIVIALVTGRVRRRIEDEIIETAVSMVTPFISYLVAEELHASGVLAVVSTGLILSHRAQLLQSARSRIFERTNWATVQFLLENTVFLLIGLQVRRILLAAAQSELGAGEIVRTCVLVTLTVMVVRPLWVFPSTYLSRMVPRVAARDPSPSWTFPAAISWAGMRGVVTLAAVFILPVSTPHREVLILIALVVVGVTLLVQGASLPWVLRRLGIGGPDEAQDALQAATVLERVSAAGLARLDELRTTEDPDDVIERLKRRSGERTEAMWERLGSSAETPSQAYARLRVQMIGTERAELIRLRDAGKVDEAVLRWVLATIDIEETVLDRDPSVEVEERQEDLTPSTVHRTCEHLVEETEVPSPHPPDGCQECLAEGLQWVHLRLCMTCGHVGCCDSSVGKHSTKHYHGTEHPVMRSFEPNEAWRWCFVDELVG